MDKIKTVYIGAYSGMTALGDIPETILALKEGRSGLKLDDRYGMVVGAIPEHCRKSVQMKDYTFFDSLVIRHLEEVLEKSGIPATDPQLLVILSTTKGNVDLLAKSLHPLDHRVYLCESARELKTYFSLAHQPIVLSNACISGVSALITGRELILSGKYRHVVVVGCDVLSEFVTSGFASFKSISETRCRPYDRDRNGLNLGEACGAILLTGDLHRAITPYIRVAGGAITNDANHISGPSRTGDGLFHAIDQAMKEAGLSKDEIGFVNTHGTATVYNDEMESKAVAWAGLDHTPLNSLKGYLGHTLGASGVIEAIITTYELKAKKIFPTLGFREPGTPCPVAVSDQFQQIGRQNCVKTASGFGGCNAALVLSMEETQKSLDLLDRKIETVAEYTLSQDVQPFSEYIRSKYRELGHPNMKFFKMSDLCKAAYVAAEHLLEGYAFSEDEPLSRRVAVLLSNRSSSLEADIRHQEILNQHHPEGASPAVFVYTLPNVATGEMCIRHKIRGCNTFFIEESDSGLSEEYAHLLLQMGKADWAICGWCELMGESWKVHLKLLKS